MAIPTEREEIHAPSGCPLPPPYSGQRAGRSSAFCSPHRSQSGGHEWVPQELVLVAWHGNVNAEGDQSL